MRGEPKSDIDLYVIATIKRLRTERKISQAALAVKLEVSDAFVGQIESPRGKSKYNLEQLNKLAQIFECSPRDFLPEKPIVSK
jgi:transcriptional regulator with XRE-family HTH domain